MLLARFVRKSASTSQQQQQQRRRLARPCFCAVLQPSKSEAPSLASSSSSSSSSPCRTPYVIGVAGGTASGKTSVCKAIMERLVADGDVDEQRVAMFSQDSFYRNLTAQEREHGVRDFNFDHPEAFDLVDMSTQLEGLRDGAEGRVPSYDYVTSSRRPETESRVLRGSALDVVLVDGILLFTDYDGGRLRSCFDLKVFVDVEADTRLARRIRRDVEERGRDVQNVLQQYELTVKPSFDTFVSPTKKHADLIVPRGAENVAAIDMMVEHVKSRCKSSTTV
ncbi:uridine/cytidine kinase [Pseudoscourfieldia marina]